MKQVYNKNITPEIPDNVPKRIFACIVLSLPATVLFILALSFLVSGQIEDFLPPLLLSAVFAAIIFLLLFFALRTKASCENVTTRPENTAIPQNPDKPFYSVQCPGCGTMFDYQRSDLAFRPWFIKGYVDCPCCHSPIRHDKKLNAYIPLRKTDNEISE